MMQVRGVKNYTVVLTPDQDGTTINVRVPAMPGVFTWGATRREALAAAREALPEGSRVRITLNNNILTDIRSID